MNNQIIGLFFMKRIETSFELSTLIDRKDCNSIVFPLYRKEKTNELPFLPISVLGLKSIIIKSRKIKFPISQTTYCYVLFKSHRSCSFSLTSSVGAQV